MASVSAWLSDWPDFVTVAAGEVPGGLGAWALLQCVWLDAWPELEEPGVSKALCGAAVDMHLDGKFRRAADAAARALLQLMLTSGGVR